MSRPSELPARFTAIRDLSDPGALETLFGPIEAVRCCTLATGGYSGSSHERIGILLKSGGRLSLVLKRVGLDRDWTAYRTTDTVGREAALLAEPGLASVWEAFRCPYRGYAAEGRMVGLLMDDLAEHLLPDVDEPLSVDQEDALLGALAALHARSWESPALRLPWLAGTAQLFAVLGPRAGEEEARRPAPPALFGLVQTGWTAALARLPEPVAALLLRSPELLADAYADLPRTLLHGDAKVANFAVLPGGAVAAFDWEWIAAGPPTLDLGWYLAVNSGRLARSKDAVAERYRSLLEAALGRAIKAAIWERMLAAGLLCGGVMLLWAKALPLNDGSPKALAEWDWWVERLSAMT